MSRRKSPSLTDGELRLMRVLWWRGRSTVSEVLEGLEERPKPAYNTVLTMLRILEHKDYVRHDRMGRAFVYEPLINRRDAQQTAVRHLLRRLFDNSPRELVLNLLENSALDAREVQELRALVERARKDAS